MKIKDIESKIIGIYKINFPNGKSYIGLSNNIKRRIREHFVDNRQPLLYSAILKYYKDVENIDFEILEEIEEEDYILLSLLEKKWIKYYNTFSKEKGYNLTEGGLEQIETKNPFSKFTNEDIIKIRERLLNGDSNVNIAKDFGVHPDTIGSINQGKRYYNKNITYPIRNNDVRKDSSGFSNHGSISEEVFWKIVKELKETSLSIKKIAELNNISYSTCVNINIGKRHNQSSLKYPIRKSFNRKLKKEQVLLIYDLLLDNTLSTEKIAQLVGCSRDTVSDVNNGKRHRIEGKKYPIRNFYPIRTKKPVSTISGTGE